MRRVNRKIDRQPKLYVHVKKLCCLGICEITSGVHIQSMTQGCRILPHKPRVAIVNLFSIDVDFV